MKRFLVVFAVVVFVAIGCTKINSQKILNGADKAAEVAGLVCSAAPLFSDGLVKPAEKCEIVLTEFAKVRNGEAVQAAVSLSQCVEKYLEEKDKLALVQCVDDIDGAELVIAAIEK